MMEWNYSIVCQGREGCRNCATAELPQGRDLFKVAIMVGFKLCESHRTSKRTLTICPVCFATGQWKEVAAAAA
jgi:hypothetical protein